MKCPLCTKEMFAGEVSIHHSGLAMGWSAFARKDLRFRYDQGREEVVVRNREIVRSWRCPQCGLSVIVDRPPVTDHIRTRRTPGEQPAGSSPL